MSFIIIYLPQAGELWTKLDDPNYIKFGAFWPKKKKKKKSFTVLTISDISLAPYWKRILQVKLDFSNRILLSKFRCSNSKIPSNCSRFNDDQMEKYCHLCKEDLLGDEFHYLFECKSLNSERPTYLDSYFFKQPNCIKFNQLFNCNDNVTQKAIL